MRALIVAGLLLSPIAAFAADGGTDMPVAHADMTTTAASSSSDCSAVPGQAKEANAAFLGCAAVVGALVLRRRLAK